MKQLGAVLVIVLALWFGLRSDNDRASRSSPSASPSASNSSGAASVSASANDGSARTDERRRTMGFRSPERLAEHYQKHGQEFAGASEADYLRMAQALRDATVGGDVLEVVRPSDGVISRFDRASGAFLAVDADGTIRTFFKPNDGEAYFRRQAKRRPAP